LLILPAAARGHNSCPVARDLGLMPGSQPGELMENQETDKTPIVASKSFLAVGPTLHYSHENVQRCWFLAFVAFTVSCLLWSKIVNGAFWTFDFEVSPSLWQLGQSITTGMSIFEYPWQILVVGLLMGILAVVPVLISQLMSFGYSLPFILGVFFVANLPGFAICLFISCFAAACRPLRFRSRFIAITLCTAPQLIYWGFLGGAKGVEPIKWGLSFSPWVCAWLVGLGIAGIVLGIGHYTRYRPGLVWIVTAVFLLLAVVTFEMRIGFDELDYQLYVAENNPEEAIEFQDHSIRESLDKMITNPSVRVRRYLESSFYPTEPILLRAKLKERIEDELERSRWPWWFTVPQELNYQLKKESLIQQYDLFISKRFQSPRMPIALYYKALLSELSPDIQVFRQKEILHFYSDYPYEKSQDIWSMLYTEFGESPESLEARWRIAKRWAGQGEFELADKLLAEAQNMLTERLKGSKKEYARDNSFFRFFRSPADSAMTMFKLADLQRRVRRLRSLIGPENRTDEPEAKRRLATFVMLNPKATNYAQELDKLLEKASDKDPLRDNILLAQAKLIADEQLRAEKLAQLHKEFQDTDGGMQALYELARLKIGLYQSEAEPERKKEYLSDARALLTSFISLYPDSFRAEQVKENLSNLPSVE